MAAHAHETRLAYLEWYVQPPALRQPKTDREWAEEHDVHPTSLVRWKKEPWFKEQLEKVYAELNIQPDRIQEVVDAMHAAATDGDVKAATLYLQYIERLQPNRVVIEDRRVEELTDDELKAILAGDSAADVLG